MAENVIQFSLLGTDKFSGMLGKLGSSLKSVVKIIAKVATAVLAAGAAVLALVNKFADLQDKVGKFADRLGVSVAELSAYQFVASQAGISTEQFNMALQRATRRIAEAAQGMGEGAGALKELGIEAKEFTHLGVEDKLTILADKLEGVTSESDKLRLAFKLFDSEGTSMLQMLKGGSAQMKAFAEDARFLGVVLSDQGTANAEKFKNSMGRAGSAIKGAGIAISQELMPVLSPMLDQFADGAARMRDSIAEGISNSIVYVVAFFNIIKQVFAGIYKIFTDGAAFKNFLENMQLYLGAAIALFINFAKLLPKVMWEAAKGVADVFTELGEWIGRNLFNALNGKELESVGTLIVDKIMPKVKKALGGIQEEFAKTMPEVKTIVGDMAGFMGDALGISWDTALTGAQLYIDKLKAVGTATVESVTQQQEALDPFWEAMRENILAFELQAGSVTQQLADLTFQTINNLVAGIGQAFAQAIVSGKSLGESIKALGKQVLTSVIAMLIKIGLQNTIFAALNKSLLASEASSKASVAVGTAAANGVASMAGAPFPVNLGAPAFGIAMGAAAAGAYSTGAALGAGLGTTAAAHGGLTNVPKEQTYLLDKGERVLSPNQNKDFTNFIGGKDSSDSSGDSGGSVTIENIEIHVLENATNAESLLNIDDREFEEIVADKIISALNALDVKGIRPVFAEKKG